MTELRKPALTFRAPNLKDIDPARHADAVVEALGLWAQDIEKGFQFLLSAEHATLRIPTTTIDAGSAEVLASSGAIAYNNFLRSYLPNTATTTSNLTTTALNYTGKGVLECVLAVAQDSSTTSTAAGVAVVITIDGNVVFNGTVSANNRLRAIVGQLVNFDPANEYLGCISDPIGLPFNETCVIQYASATNGQGVTIGWRVSKKR